MSNSATTPGCGKTRLNQAGRQRKRVFYPLSGRPFPCQKYLSDTILGTSVSKEIDRAKAGGPLISDYNSCISQAGRGQPAKYLVIFGFYGEMVSSGVI